MTAAHGRNIRRKGGRSDPSKARRASGPFGSRCVPQALIGLRHRDPPHSTKTFTINVSSRCEQHSPKGPSSAMRAGGCPSPERVQPRFGRRFRRGSIEVAEIVRNKRLMTVGSTFSEMASGVAGQWPPTPSGVSPLQLQVSERHEVGAFSLNRYDTADASEGAGSSAPSSQRVASAQASFTVPSRSLSLCNP